MTKWVIKGVLSAIFLFLAGLSYLSATRHIESSNTRDHSSVTSTIFPNKFLRRSLIAELQSGNIVRSEELANQLALLAPLDELPYETAMLIAAEQGDEVRASSFAHQAIARQPRSLAGRLFLLSASARHGDFNGVIHQFERLLEIRSLNSNSLIEALLDVFRESGDWSQLILYLTKEPNGGRDIVDRILFEPALPPDIESLIRAYPHAQEKYLNRLMHEFGIETAHEAWLSMTESKDKHTVEFPFNGGFFQRAEPPPFNWSIPYKRAELSAGGGLYVSFSGMGKPLIARQILSAPPGNYLLKSEAGGSMPKNGGALEWRVLCHGHSERLVVLVLELNKNSSREVFEAEFTIPSRDCQFQTIELRGRAGAYPRTSRTEIYSLSINAHKKPTSP